MACVNSYRDRSDLGNGVHQGLFVTLGDVDVSGDCSSDVLLGIVAPTVLKYLIAYLILLPS